MQNPKSRKTGVAASRQSAALHYSFFDIGGGLPTAVRFILNFLRISATFPAFGCYIPRKRMAFSSAKNLIATVADATPTQFDDWRKSWRAAVTGGSTEPLLTFIARERGVAEDVFLQKLASALGWPYLDLPKHTVPAEARNKISTKVAFQYSVLPAAVNNGMLQLAASDPFDAAMMNAVRFDAQMPVSSRWRPKPKSRRR